MSVWWHRLAVAVLCVLLGAAGLMLAETAEPAAPPPVATMKWVRAREGWQLATCENEQPTRCPALHPLVLATFITMASITALLAFSRARSDEPDRHDPTSGD
jgi:hypothetical protein